jgi:hypothetical protein
LGLLQGMRVAWNEKELREGYELCTQVLGGWGLARELAA